MCGDWYPINTAKTTRAVAVKPVRQKPIEAVKPVPLTRGQVAKKSRQKWLETA
jgi:hypothetical protein